MSEPISQIYRLVDPLTGETRYIGQTCNALQSRLGYHLGDCASHGISKWVKELAEKGCKPSIELLEEVPVDIVNDAERYWIGKYRYAGARLLNVRPGGERDYVKVDGLVKIHIPKLEKNAFIMAAEIKQMNLDEWLLNLARDSVGLLISKGDIFITEYGEKKYVGSETGEFWLQCRPENQVQEIEYVPCEDDY